MNLWNRKVSDYQRHMRIRRRAETEKLSNVRNVWDPWEPEWNCEIEERMGEPAWGDGAKFMCNPQRSLQTSSCLVYSFGSNGKIQFERAVKALNPSCEIHVFDPTDSPSVSAVVSSVGQFHLLGLGSESKKFSLGRVEPLADIMRQLGHSGRRLTVLKVDVEGAEWDSFSKHIWELCSSGQLRIGQLQIELHLRGDDRSKQRVFFNGADSCGLMIFHKERNSWGCGGFRCVEYALVHRDTALAAFIDSHCPSVAEQVVDRIRSSW